MRKPIRTSSDSLAVRGLGPKKSIRQPYHPAAGLASPFPSFAATPYHAAMPIPDRDIVDVSTTRLGRTESLFIPNVFKGLGTTLRHAFQNIGRNGSNKETLWVVQYPEQKRDDRPVEEGGQYRPNFRGVHRLNRDEDGRVRCVACFMCATACPANCIHIVAEESPWEDREKYPKQFDIDELRCIYCGMCEEACPCDAIELTPHYEVTGLSRQELIFDKTKLLEVYDQTIGEKPM
jgi:NADH-quinone oxidoreductase subunit I